MRYKWEFDHGDVEAVRQLVEKWKDSGLVAERRRRNCCAQANPVPRDWFWNAMLMCLLTSQQRSGPKSAVVRFLEQSPFPLTAVACDGVEDVQQFVANALSGFSGIRNYNRIGEYAAKNLPMMSGAKWHEVEFELEHLRAHRGLQHERRAANFIDDRFWGIGPKQARNLLQMVGLTRLVMPIDSRIVKWMRTLGFPLSVSSNVLGDRSYYEFVEDGLIELAERSGVEPCILDAAVFASFDSEPWTEENSVW
jgi:thermostable 8-oxoguanine DNA glycosylase